MSAARAFSSHRGTVGLATLLSIGAANICLADAFTACGIQVPDMSRYQKVAIVSVIPKKLRVLDPMTRKSTGDRIRKEELIQQGEAVRDAYGLICLQKADRSGHVWTYSSTVKYRCVVKSSSELIKSASGPGGMGLGTGGCKDDEW